MSIRPEELADVIMEELRNYSEEVTEQIKEDVRNIAKECVKQIKLRAPVNTGEYKKGWKFKVVHNSATDIRIVVYNAKKPQLTHLLEYGYAKVNGGRVDGIRHILPAEQIASREMANKVKVAVKQR